MNTVEILCLERPDEPPTRRQVTAIPTTTPGLVVTPACFRQEGYEGWWTLTHVATGRCLPEAYFSSSQAVVAFADDLRELTDWTATDPERCDGFTAAYCELTARHGGRNAYELAEEEA